MFSTFLTSCLNSGGITTADNMIQKRNCNPHAQQDSSLKFLSRPSSCNKSYQGTPTKTVDPDTHSMEDKDDEDDTTFPQCTTNSKSQESGPPNMGLALDSTSESDSLDEEEEEGDGMVETYTVYLIRHGEACHNVLEKEAKQKALELALADGHAPDSTYAKEQMEEARKDVLNDTNLFDAPLSNMGKEEAQKASKAFYQELLIKHNLPRPKEVLVSPLQRTLQTADVMFPDPHEAQIRVREELRERCTGKPPDNRASSATLSFSPLYKRFSMERLRRHSLDAKDPTSDMRMMNNDDDDEHGNSSPCCAEGSNSEATTIPEEDKPALRVRTNKLWGLLAESKERVIAIVTHKAYLRELERGPLERPNATEFQNGEVRAYQITINRNSQELLEAERIV